MSIFDPLIKDEAARLDAFPISRNKIFMGHAGVTALPRAVADAMVAYSREASENFGDFAPILRQIEHARESSASFIGASPDEIALLGPTSLGLSLFANGIPWEKGDEILCYADDYPANVYPWIDLRRLGVEVRYLQPEAPGAITPELVEASLSPRTRLVALASCHFLTGYRLNVDAIGKLLRKRGILFSLDAIQTLGAFPLSVKYVDFLSADAHKWMLGPMAIGIVYVRKEHFPLLRPTLLGAWNVYSPNFIAQDSIRLPETAMRYEPGVLNMVGIHGMQAALDLLEHYGMEAIAGRLLELKKALVHGLRELDCEIHGPSEGANASSITTFSHTTTSMGHLFRACEAANIVVSLRHRRDGKEFIRVSPHFYNTHTEIERLLETLRIALQ